MVSEHQKFQKVIVASEVNRTVNPQTEQLQATFWEGFCLIQNLDLGIFVDQKKCLPESMGNLSIKNNRLVVLNLSLPRARIGGGGKVKYIQRIQHNYAFLLKTS